MRQVFSVLKSRGINQADLAAICGVSVQAVNQWKICPKSRARELEGITGVHRYELRPDLYAKADA